MELRRYGQWGGMPKGVAEDVTRCIEEVHPAGRSIIPSQCRRKRGHGKDGLYCKQHARMQERKLTRRAADAHPEHDKDCWIHIGYGLCNCGIILRR